MYNLRILDKMILDMISDMQNFAARNIPAEGGHFYTIGKSFPKFDISSSDEAYEIVAAVPGYKREDFELEILDEDGQKLLSLKSNRQSNQTSMENKVKEIHRSSFHRSILLPKDADYKNIKSTLADGLLSITIPRIKKERQLIAIQ